MNNPKISKKNIFKVPDEYFDQLEASVHDQIQTLKSPKRSGVILLRPRFAVTMAAVLAILIIFFYWPSTEKLNPYDLLADATDEQLANYLAENEPIGNEDLLFFTDISDSEIMDITPIETDSSF
jgi:hypothetical protein